LEEKLKDISNNLGPLSMIIFLRLEKFYQIMLNATHQSDHEVFLQADE